jgi:hypothetical protein
VPQVIPIDHPRTRIFAEALGKLASPGSLQRMLVASVRQRLAPIRVQEGIR